jgi:putrescine aminotransferase
LAIQEKIMKIGIDYEPSPEEKAKIVDECIDNYNNYLNRSIVPRKKSGDARVVEWEGEGCLMRDINGREFIDCLGGYGIFALGHRHPRIIKAITAQLGRLALHSQELLNPIAAEAAKRLAEITPGNLKKAFWCSSGTESIEGALKLARLYTGKKKFVSTINSFHGKTFGSLSVTGRHVFREPFLPLLEVELVHYGNASAIEAAIDDDTAAVILEPVQGEGGVIIPPPDYLPKVREICTRKGALLILDEVQTGLGRTGAMFGCNHSNVVPDILCIAKALSGGVIPVGVFTSTDEIWRAFEPNPFYHTSTFGGNPLATTAAATTIEVLKEENLVERCDQMGNYFLRSLRELSERHHSLISEVRGKGLLIGVEIIDTEHGKSLAQRLFNHGVLVAHTLNKPEVIRIEPPFIITKELIDRVLEIFETCLKEESAKN